MRGEHLCFQRQGKVLRWAREGEAPGGGILWWNVDDIYRAAFPMDADKSMDEAREFALSAMRCGRGEDADMLLERHLCRKEAEMSISHRSIVESKRNTRWTCSVKCVMIFSIGCKRQGKARKPGEELSSKRHHRRLAEAGVGAELEGAVRNSRWQGVCVAALVTAL